MSLALSLRSALEATAKSTALEFCTEMDESATFKKGQRIMDIRGKRRLEEAQVCQQRFCLSSIDRSYTD
jgi:hypothetical protein